MLLIVSEVDSKSIPSNWQASEVQESVVSATELATRQQRVKLLEEQKLQEEIQMQAEISAMRAKRSALLDCLSDKGVMLFTKGTGQCKACREQNEYFGEDLSKLKVIDCEKSKLECPLRGIKAYPTWYLGKYLGLMKEGVKDLPTIAKLTNCPW